MQTASFIIDHKSRAPDKEGFDSSFGTSFLISYFCLKTLVAMHWSSNEGPQHSASD